MTLLTFDCAADPSIGVRLVDLLKKITLYARITRAFNGNGCGPALSGDEREVLIKLLERKDVAAYPVNLPQIGPYILQKLRQNVELNDTERVFLTYYLWSDVSIEISQISPGLIAKPHPQVESTDQVLTRTLATAYTLDMVYRAMIRAV